MSAVSLSQLKKANDKADHGEMTESLLVLTT